MKRVVIKISFKCNNHCKFCVQGNKRESCQDKTFHDIKANLRESKDDYGEVIFTGGEPTIRPDIIKLVEYSKGLGYMVHIQTNGRMFAYKEFCKKIVKAGAESFTVSIHGHNGQLHDTLTGAEGSFEQTLSGIKHLQSLGVRVFTNTVITSLNYRFLPTIATMLVNLGIFEYRLTFPHILGSALANRDSIVPRKREIASYLKKALEIGINRKRAPMTEGMPYCFLDGHINCAHENYTPEARVFGTKLTEDFNRWRREEGKVKGPKCKKCKYFQSCEGPWREYPEIFGWEEFVPVK